MPSKLPRADALRKILAEAWVVIRASEGWAQIFKQTPDQWKELIRSENRMLLDLKVYFRILAAERATRMVNWSLYNTKVIKADEGDGIVIDITSDQAQAEEQLLMGVIMTEIQTGMIQGALAGQQSYTVWLGQSEISTLVQEQAREYVAALANGLTQTTLKAVRTSIETSIRQGEDIFAATERLRHYLDDVGPDRAELIARTESVRAYNAGIVAYGRKTGALQKSWESLPGADEGAAVQPCVDNSDQGAIAVDDLFSSGDDYPPAHPRCRCSVSLVYDTGEGEVTIDDNYA